MIDAMCKNVKGWLVVHGRSRESFFHVYMKFQELGMPISAKPTFFRAMR